MPPTAVNAATKKITSSAIPCVHLSGVFLPRHCMAQALQLDDVSAAGPDLNASSNATGGNFSSVAATAASTVPCSSSSRMCSGRLYSPQWFKNC
jgi:hypothetical protein